MAKHTQTIRWLLPTNCLSVFDHFVGFAVKGLLQVVANFETLCIEVLSEFKRINFRSP